MQDLRLNSVRYLNILQSLISIDRFHIDTAFSISISNYIPKQMDKKLRRDGLNILSSVADLFNQGA
jgi:hypothetical protein